MRRTTREEIFNARMGYLNAAPTGQIMRSRLKAYEEASKYRAQRNERYREEPSSIDEIPA